MLTGQWGQNGGVAKIPDSQASLANDLVVSCCVLAPSDGIKAVDAVCFIFCSRNLFCNDFLFPLTVAASERNENSFSWPPLQASH